MFLNLVETQLLAFLTHIVESSRPDILKKGWKGLLGPRSQPDSLKNPYITSPPLRSAGYRSANLS